MSDSESIAAHQLIAKVKIVLAMKMEIICMSAPYPAVISYRLTGMGAQTKSTKSAQTLQEQKKNIFLKTSLINASCFC